VEVKHGNTPIISVYKQKILRNSESEKKINERGTERDGERKRDRESET
jgi:hypothetical protein